jgi:uncharacterized protein (TIGR03435 family)
MYRYAAALASLLSLPVLAQQTAPKPQFEVISIRENQSNVPNSSNFPLNSGPQYTPNAGQLRATHIPLLQLLVFAYKPDMYQIQSFRTQLPGWARSTSFDVEAHAAGTPDKDQMRVLVQSLLEDRFALRVHRETREIPIFALVLAKPGKLGPKLQPHPADDPTCTKSPLPDAIPGAYPVVCGAAGSIPAKTPGDLAGLGRNVTTAYLAQAVGGIGSLTDRPVLDQTGLTGTYDFSLEFAPETAQTGPTADPNLVGSASFSEALREQLGLKLVARKAPVNVLVIDHIEKPTPN